MKDVGQIEIIGANRLSLADLPRVKEWCNGRVWSHFPMRAVTGLTIDTPKGEKNVPFGDWILLDWNGNLHTCTNRRFQRIWDEAENP